MLDNNILYVSLRPMITKKETAAAAISRKAGERSYCLRLIVYNHSSQPAKDRRAGVVAERQHSANALARALTRPSWLEYRDMINGIRQPQLSTTARPSTVVTNPLRADPRRTPLQAPTSAKLPKNPRWPAAEHSTRNIEEVVYSPPTESP